jgi:hypothetical protein
MNNPATDRQYFFDDGLRFECTKCGHCCSGSPGKVFLADEVWRWCSPNAIPKELAALAQMGRSENLELVTATQLPHKIHASITGQSTEMVCFRVNEPLALDKVQELGGDRDAVQALPLGSFISWNRLSQARLDGRVF